MSSFIDQDRELNGDSRIWANWMSELSPTSCRNCVKQHGKIFEISVVYYTFWVNDHPNCNCIYVPMRTKRVGSVTNAGSRGVDVILFYGGQLPDFYIGKRAARREGWLRIDNRLSEVIPGRMIGGDVYQNRNGKLPSVPGRIWYEADINYVSGYRNRQRILYSNDGLMFATYDHYHTFYEITN